MKWWSIKNGIYLRVAWTPVSHCSIVNILLIFVSIAFVIFVSYWAKSNKSATLCFDTFRNKHTIWQINNYFLFHSLTLYIPCKRLCWFIPRLVTSRGFATAGFFLHQQSQHVFHSVQHFKERTINKILYTKLSLMRLGLLKNALWNDAINY